MTKKIGFAWAMLLTALMCVSASAQDNAPQEPGRAVAPIVSEQQNSNTLHVLSDTLQVLTQEEAAGKVTPEDAKVLRDGVLKIAGNYGTFDQESLEKWNGRQAVLSWTTILKIVGSLVIAAGVVLFLALMLGSPELLEGAAYVLAAALVFGSSTYLGAADAFWGVFIGALIFSGAFSYSFGTRNKDYQIHGIASVLTMVWGALAVVYSSYLCGFIAVCALETLLGFAILPIGIGYVIGWAEAKQMPRGTIASFALLAGGVALHLFAPQMEPQMAQTLLPFKQGLLLVGSLVGFIGLLCMSSKWYLPKSKNWWVDVLMVAAAAACMYFGSVFAVPYVVGVATWLLFFWLLDKWVEISFNEWAWAFSLMGAGGMIWGLVKVIEMYPDYFVFWM